MKKKFLSKRFMALALAATMVVGEPAVAFAAPADAAQPATSEAVTDEGISAEGAYDGSVSQVIGLRVGSWNTSWNDESKLYPYIYWNSLSTEHVTTYNGKLIKIGYEVQKNGVTVSDYYESADKKYKFTSGTGYSSSDDAVAPGASITYRVRGLYYIENEKADGSKEYTVFKEGPWSANLTATATKKQAYPKVSGLKAAVREGKVVFSWTKNPDISSYEYEYFRTTTPITPNWDDPDRLVDYDTVRFYDDNSTSRGYTELEESDNDAPIYFYFRVRPESMGDYNKWDYSTREQSWSTAVTATVPAQSTALEAVTGLRAEYGTDGGVTIKWNKPKNKNLSGYLYVIEGTSLPAYWNYRALNASDADWDYSLYEKLDEVTQKNLDEKVNSHYIDSVSDYNDGYSPYFKPGVTYTVVLVTYDRSNNGKTRTPIYTVNGTAFTHYNDVAASNQIKVQTSLKEPSVSYSPAKTSIKLSMSNAGYATGYEIWRKGKKWTRLTATVGNTYTDKKLKSGKHYTYRVRSFYYDATKDVKTFGPYVTVTAETTPAKVFQVTATKVSTSSVKLSWQKIKGATKYEVYRSIGDIGDAETGYSQFTPVSSVDALTDPHYMLVKSTKKNNVTVKKLSKGVSYDFYVVAYFKNNKKSEAVFGHANASMQLSTPVIAKKSSNANSATLTWQKDKFASKYEVKYMIYDADGLATKDDYTYQTISKNSFTVTGIPSGGYTDIDVRAISKDSRYSEYAYYGSGTDIHTTIGVVKGIKAAKTTITVNGVKREAVQISWKPVSGAAYYGVYRSTRQEYDPDTKSYYIYGTSIAQEGNDDEGSNTSSYRQYKNQSGTITATSAIDAAILPEGVTYYYTVVAYGPYDALTKSFGDGERSSKPAKYTSPSGIKITTTSVKKGKAMSWTAPVYSKKYYIYRAKKKNGTYTLVGTSKKPSFKDKKAKKGTWFYKIVAENGNTYGADSASAPTKVKIK